MASRLVIDTTSSCVAKYATRMGQCFSSTYAVQQLLVDDIREIPDVSVHFLMCFPAGYKGVLCQSNFSDDNQAQVRLNQLKLNRNIVF
ncbi:putative RNA-directed RNA polymerase [Rhizophagus irregularis DAOM 181602=DAOM 197198]|uniref:RNA-dependent RNA polymerase n=1 Tax=Rhizophagus irregularis (strain DAOM 181602 / DAOM 197198 / MUCL 43194) TaxID=747089 RepID=U9TMT4_RHIID|nr:putative RNA-directed RNA polymerase [Rhizophagus irregularis DAOM 181602=DAOM 197198]